MASGSAADPSEHEYPNPTGARAGRPIVLCEQACLVADTVNGSRAQELQSKIAHLVGAGGTPNGIDIADIAFLVDSSFGRCN